MVEVNELEEQTKSALVQAKEALKTNEAEHKILEKKVDMLTKALGAFQDRYPSGGKRPTTKKEEEPEKPSQ